MPGRPLRFLGLVIVGWTGARAALLWPNGEPAPELPSIAAAAAPGPPPIASTPPPSPAAFSALTLPIPPLEPWDDDEPAYVADAALALPPLGAAVPRAANFRAEPLPRAYLPPGSPVAARVAYRPESGIAADVAGGVPEDPPGGTPGTRANSLVAAANTSPTMAPASPAAPAAFGRSRLSASAWLLARGDGAAGLTGLGATQLGGSQTGLRVAYAIDGARRLSLVGRFSAPLQGVGREAALGLAWQPTRWPVQLIAEQRFGLDGQRGGPTLGLIGGAGPLPIAGNWTLEGYGQAGAIRRNGVEGFVDGSLRFAHPLIGWGPLKLDLGLGVWGGAQRGAHRLDAGPSLVPHLPGALRRTRVSLDWRQRLLGRAHPRSGPALTVGTDF